MATNKKYELAIQLQWKVGTGVLSGQPVMMGSVAGVCLVNADAAGLAPVDMEGVYSLAVVGADHAGNAAVNNGDALYGSGANGSLVINKDSTSGVLFGYAYSETVTIGSQLVASAATTTISVILARP
jgi:predicted RecA/RadA family phage recombinase